MATYDRYHRETPAHGVRHRHFRARCWATSVLSLGLAAASGCAGPEGDLDIEKSTEGLYGFLSPGATYWNGALADGTGAGAPAAIEVCWGRNATLGRFGNGDLVTAVAPASNFPGFATVSKWWREAVEDTWGRDAWIQFHGWGTCASNGISDRDDYTLNPGKMMFYFGDTIASGSAADMSGKVSHTASPAFVSAAGGGNFRQVWQAYAIHEVGHLLGFAHEQQRPDNWSGGAPTTCVSLAQGEGALQNGMYWNTNGTTTFIDKESVLCYDQKGGYQLSAGDVMGLQKVYGRKPPGAVVGYGGRSVAIAGASTAVGGSLISWPTSDQWHLLFKQTKLPGSSVTEGLSATTGSTQRCWNVTGSGSTRTIKTATCANNSNQQFPAANMLWRGIGNVCVVASSRSAGATLKIQACGSSNAERWDFLRATGQIRLNGSSLCVATATSNPPLGQLPTLKTCASSGSSTQTFTFSTHDQIRIQNLCMAVFGGMPTAGSAVGLWDGCNSVPQLPHEQFSMRGRLKTVGDRCTAWQGNLSDNAAVLEARTCQPAPTAINQTGGVPWVPKDPQDWDLYW